MKKNIKDFPVLTFLYIIAGIAFGLAILKFFIFSPQFTASSLLMEIFSLLFFLAFIFIADKTIRFRGRSKEAVIKESEETICRLEKDNSRLIERVKHFEDKENETLRFASYKEKVMEKIFSQKSQLKDYGSFLHLLSEVFQAGAIILYKETEQNGQFNVEASYAVPEDFQFRPFSVGEGLNGQAVADGVPMVVEDVPDHFLPISSGLGESASTILYLLPVMKEGKCIYLIEMATFVKYDIVELWESLSHRLVEKGIL